MIWDTFNDPLVHNSVESLFEKYVYGDPADGPVGEKYSYCSTGYALLGMIIEEASTMSLGGYFEQEIIESLGLVNTYFKNTPEYPDDVQYKTNRYMEQAPGQIQNCTDFTNNLASIAMGDIGLFATPYEYARFYQELLRGNVLDSSTMQLMLNDEIRIPEEEESYQCLGLEHDKSNVFGDIYWHGGGWFGTLSRTKYFPGSDVTISINTNGTGFTFHTDETLNRFSSLVDEIEKVTFTGERN
ncbi:MAG: serine hydrolase [Bacteroidales bacterium]|nr:serine hydrolase [Bacteroidales bacterium]